MKTFSILVVALSDGLWFKLRENLFVDRLEAFNFDRSSVEVIRNGVQISKGYVTGHGGMDYTSYFHIPGIHEDLCPKHPDLWPREFSSGDQIIFGFEVGGTNSSEMVIENILDLHKRNVVNAELYKFYPGDWSEFDDDKWRKINEEFAKKVAELVISEDIETKIILRLNH